MNSIDQNKKLQKVVLLNEGKIATAEEQIVGSEAERAIDGRDDTYWAASPYYKWWKIDLLNIYHISQLTICTGSEEGGYTHYFIEYSHDNLNWATIINKSDNTHTTDSENYEVSFNARYIRVTITYSSNEVVAKIRDFKVFGHELKIKEDVSPRKVSPYKFPAVSYDEAVGFNGTEVDNLEPGRQEKILIGGEVGSYLLFRDVNFQNGVDQLRGQFGLTDKNNQKQIIMEVRLGDLDGEIIGEMILFRQWKTWSILGGHLEHSDSSLLSGIHDVYLVIKASDPSQQLMIHWLAFVKKSPLPEPKLCSKVLSAPIDNNYKVYFGNLHSHTSFSDGEGVPEQAFDYARYTAGLDFLALTEHSNLYDHYLDWDKSRKWSDIQKMADQKTEDGAFLAMVGSETTWYNEFGHMNTYNMDFFINTYETQYNEIPRYYETLKQYSDSIQQWNHPWSCGNRHLDGFGPYDSELDEVLHLIELNPVISKELGGLYYYIKALDKGWHVSPVGNQDNHRANWGTQNNLRTAVLVDQLTREHFFDAVRKNRVYFTSALYLKVFFQINGAIMGSRIKQSDFLNFNIKALYSVATGYHMVKAEIIGEHGYVFHTIEMDSDQCDLEFSLPCKSRYYLVKIYQDDGEIAVTSPIWIEMERALK